MFKKFTNGCVKLVSRFLPDAFVFCIILTIIVFIIAMPVTGMNPIQVANAWGSGVWNLLSFSMQMALVLVLGTAFANAPLVKKALKALAGIPKKPTQAIFFVTIISMICCWLNWGFGLVVGALLAKEVTRKVPGVDYRLIIASAYSGFVVWHAGVSGSIPLAVASWSESLQETTGGAVTEAVLTTETIFSAWNLIMVIVIMIVVSIVNMLMHPKKEDVVTVDPALLAEPEIEKKKPETPAEKIESSPVLTIIIAVLCVGYIIYYFVNGGSLDLNAVNLIFLTLGIIFHGNPISYVHAITDAAKGAGGIILQFPFYAGIAGMMTGSLEGGVSLAQAISNGFVAISTARTFPVFAFLSAGIVNFFVPSGGGQWTVQAPLIMPAGVELGVPNAVSAMAIAWGDAWTNMLQPFWALPALGIAGLGARDIMGYCVIVLLVTGVIIVLGFLFLVPLMAY